MDHYVIWFNLRDTSRDVAFTKSLAEFLGRLADHGAIEGYALTRRKLGFGPPELGEFMLDVRVRDLAQLEAAFGGVAPRVGAMEKAHAAVWSQVVDFRSGLFRDFPDAVRGKMAEDP
jgi:hypothetical protein